MESLEMTGPLWKYLMSKLRISKQLAKLSVPWHCVVVSYSLSFLYLFKQALILLMAMQQQNVKCIMAESILPSLLFHYLKCQGKNILI